MHTLHHFPVMQENNLNPDITVSDYTFDDDSACVTQMDSHTFSAALIQAQLFKMLRE